MNTRMRILVHALPLLLGVVMSRAGTNVDESPAFPLETRSDTGNVVSLSNDFALDVRNRGNVGTSGSASFALNTILSTLDSLAITGGPTSVIAGQPNSYAAWASFANGASQNVSPLASWSVVGNAPAGTGFAGNVLTAGSVTAPTALTIRASYTFTSGMRYSQGYAVMIHPGTPPYKAVATYFPTLTSVLGQRPAVWRVNFNAATGGPEGAAQSQNIRWDFEDADSDFDDATGAAASRSFLGGQTIRIGVEAQWPQPGAPAERASLYFYVTLDKEPVAGEPTVELAKDILKGGFLDGSEKSTVFLPARKQKGLVLLTHGIWGSGKDGWLKDMLGAVNSRFGGDLPNVGIYDWEKMADPTLFRTGEQTAGASQRGAFKIDDYKTVRPYGQAQGVVVKDLIERQEALGNVLKSAPVHLIGHSAGGFVMGEAARLLNQRGYSNIQVTMLDTPLPFHEHIQPAWKVERYISSWIGGYPENTDQAALWNAASKYANSRVETFPINCTSKISRVGGIFFKTSTDCSISWQALVSPGSRYYRSVVSTSHTGLEERHADSHRFYEASIIQGQEWEGGVPTDGFAYSPLLTSGNFAGASGGASALGKFEPSPALQASMEYLTPLEGFSTFGNVAVAGGIYTITEAENAGLTIETTLPWDAVALKFAMRFAALGDGDFVSVHWNDEPPLGIIPGTEMESGAWLTHEFPIAAHAGEAGRLTIKLVSRGEANAVVEVANIEIVTSDDLDGDGLTNDEELALGADPTQVDSDGDGLDDAYEAQTAGTSPTAADTDGDGKSDGEELHAGTSPRDGGSFFAVDKIELDLSGTITLRWQGHAGRWYRIHRSTDLQALSYDTVGWDIPGFEGPMSRTTMPPAGADRCFYWIEVQ